MSAHPLITMLPSIILGLLVVIYLYFRRYMGLSVILGGFLFSIMMLLGLERYVPVLAVTWAEWLALATLAFEFVRLVLRRGAPRKGVF
uniref:Uncharacterized protein n=1 Tax=mine drainage metagenome TaxID=410659 RepID=E6Q6D3_9ZZZZ